MSSFTGAKFEAVVDDNGNHVERYGRKLYAIRGEVGDGLTFHIGYIGSGLSVSVPEGYVTDGPSVPTLASKGWLKLVGLLALVIPRSVYEGAMKSAAVHDYLCEHKGFSRPDADGQFWVAMNAEGTPAFWRSVFFKAVTINKSKRRYHDQPFPGEDQLDLFSR